MRAGVLERLAVAPRALAELARELGLHPAPLGVVLDALSHFGIVRRGPDGYELDDEGRVLLPAASDRRATPCSWQVRFRWPRSRSKGAAQRYIGC